MKPPILIDFPESFETERLSIRSPLPGDGREMHAAVRESIEELSPGLTWPKEHRSVDDSEASARRARVASYSVRSSGCSSTSKERTRWWGAAGCKE